VDHVAVLHHVFLAFQPPLAGVLRALLALVVHEIVVGDHLGADEALLEVGVDHAGGLWRGGADAHGPGAHFLHAGGEVGLQVQQLGSRRESRGSGRAPRCRASRRNSALLVLELGDLGLELVADRHHHRAFGSGDFTRGEVRVVLKPSSATLAMYIVGLPVSRNSSRSVAFSSSSSGSERTG
jgi:hypothetical protein